MLELLTLHPGFLENEKTVYLKHSHDVYDVYMVTKLFHEVHETIFVVCPNLYEAQKYYDLFNQINDEQDILFYPTDETLTFMMALGSPEFRSERLYTIKQLMTQKPFIVVLTQHGLSQRQLTPQDYQESVKTLKKGETASLEGLVRYLIYSGYDRVYTVEKPGEFSVRGHIVDIYSLNDEHPFRLDFFGDEIDEIKHFNVETQRSFEQLESIEIAPMHELFYTDEMKELAIKRINKFFSKEVLSHREEAKLDEDIEHIAQRNQLDGLGIYMSFFNVEKTHILSFSNKHRLIYVNVEKMKLNQEQTEEDLKTYAMTMSGSAFLKLPFRLEFSELIELKHIEIDHLGFNQDKGIDLKVSKINEYQGNLLLFYHDMVTYSKAYRIYILCKTKSFEMEIKSFLMNQKEKIYSEIGDEPGFYVLGIEGYGSFIAHQEKIVILDEVQIFSRRMRKAIKYRSVLNQSSKIRTTDDLNVGDYVVHYDYGIGRYVGLKTMELSGEKRDYLQIVYLNEESLYVPMDQIDMVLKYATHDGMKPKLSKMGGKTWNKTKTNVRMKIKDLSDRLIKLYATREKTEGFKFEPDNEMQLQFERDFLYEPTRDQVKTIIETKSDMETQKPMDRLICGDVGFGKTEVAMRAAFKAVLNQKQVLYLVPTTVLARQHYYTFKDRFEKYGANIALMSRFVTTKQQNETLKKLSKGYVDVVIGTHRLLSKDIVFKDLGLLIVDEEQRFGVEHKERIREIKQNVDTLTLSATPIPRTLQMSLLGLKDLSMIETPPMNRYPVQTYVVERHDALVKEAIMREIARGGQVFYLFNRVQGMEGMVKRLQRLVPEARIGYAHGKMNRTQLESTLSDFIEHEFDVLVSTTIIETGVDIPNTNTLIIHEADRLGLSQLYQIRGRVGRSDRIAYAYLLYDPGKLINDEAKKRLSAIKDFTALGSGYKIALRDLSIRGAGDILGAEQSGFVDSVGVELYMKLLEEAITGETMDQKKPTQIDEVFAARHVDQAYVSEDSARIEIHKRISELNHIEDVEDLKDELTDRYGTLDVDLILYMYEKLYKKLAYKFGVQKTMVGAYTTTLMLSQEASQQLNGQSLFRKASAFDPKIDLKYERRHIYLTMNTQKTKAHWLYLFAKFLDEYFQEKVDS